MKQIGSRTIGLLALISGGLYLCWLFNHININAPILSIIFLAFSVFSYLSTILLVINNWSYKVAKPYILANGNEPKVGIIIPTCGEPVEMLSYTIESIANQNYPLEKIKLIVSDDADSLDVYQLTNRLRLKYPQLDIVYNVPPKKGTEKRIGDAKAGNLNSALNLLSEDPEIEYIETRDHDDLVGNKDFLRASIAQMVVDDKLAFVQGIKTIQENSTDPFANQEKLFYKSLMFSKNAANAVFPCGSGLVWRKKAILEIGGFPIWNIVEDFQSGAEVLRKKWKGLFIPFVAAVAQISPEDIPNLYKQRTTWAMDAIRFTLWGNKKGLNLRQRLHFFESTWLYFMSTVFFFQSLIPVAILILDINPVSSNPLTYALNISPYLLSIFLYIMSLRRNQSIRFMEIIKSFQVTFGLGFEFLKAFFKVMSYGPNRKPAYKVTRKYHQPGIYFANVLPQILLVIALGYSIFTTIINTHNIMSIDWVTLGWASFYIYMVGYTIRLSIYKPFRKDHQKEQPLFDEKLDILLQE